MAQKAAMSNDVANHIRKNWNEGRKFVTIGDIELRIQLSEHKVVIHNKDGSHERRVEKWLVASPVNDKLVVPVYSIELEPGKNSRVAR
jgi:hypothetical protein